MIDASRRTRGLQFTRDGKSVVYAMRENGVDNIWISMNDLVRAIESEDSPLADD